eukprot:scaffold17119_cov123-Isochrysis_galbana.AAC.1
MADCGPLRTWCPAVHPRIIRLRCDSFTHQITQELTPPHPHSPQKGKSKATPPTPRPPPIEEEAPDEGACEWCGGCAPTCPGQRCP